jgi:hypothetical protein
MGFHAEGIGKQNSPHTPAALHEEMSQGLGEGTQTELAHFVLTED